MSQLLDIPEQYATMGASPGGSLSSQQNTLSPPPGDFSFDTAELNFEENLTTALAMADAYGDTDERTKLCRMAVTESFWAALRLVHSRPDLFARFVGRV